MKACNRLGTHYRYRFYYLNTHSQPELYSTLQLIYLNPGVCVYFCEEKSGERKWRGQVLRTPDIEE
jgi:hypothetical protein